MWIEVGTNLTDTICNTLHICNKLKALIISYLLRLYYTTALKKNQQYCYDDVHIVQADQSYIATSQHRSPQQAWILFFIFFKLFDLFGPQVIMIRAQSPFGKQPLARSGVCGFLLMVNEAQREQHHEARVTTRQQRVVNMREARDRVAVYLNDRITIDVIRTVEALYIFIIIHTM